jgi:hypothetical protein
MSHSQARPPHFWSRFTNRLRFGLATQEVLDRLARLGLVFYPYYLVYEPMARSDPNGSQEPLQTRFLKSEEASLIASLPDRPKNESGVREQMLHSTCVGLVENGQLLAYTWFTREKIRIPASATQLCDLPEDWAYLFEMYVRPEARSRGMAGQIRSRGHQMLANEGVKHCCSITLKFNRSARRFKAKVGAVEMELRLLLRLNPFPGVDLRLWRKPWPLKTPAALITRAARNKR